MLDTLIDTGTAPEIFVDGLGEIKIVGQMVEFYGYRWRGTPSERVVALVAIVPIGAVPDIAAQIAGAFAGVLNRRVKEILSQITVN